MVAEVLRRWPGHGGNWGRWPNDRGTLNLLGPEAAKRGFATVRQGEVIGCARTLSTEDLARPTPSAGVRMMTAGDLSIEVQSAKDEMWSRTHGRMNTHIDALGHYGFHDHGFNGGRFSEHVTMAGCERWDVTAVGPIVTRGVFVDVARQRGVPYLEPGDSVRAEEIAAAAALVEPGDAFVIRTGVTLKAGPKATEFRADSHEGALSAGLHPDCVELLGPRDVCLIATDTPNERLPAPGPDPCRAPVHVLSLVVFGIHLIHNMDLEALGAACAAQGRDGLGRDSFLFIVSPLKVPRSTGVLVAPLAVL